ncbi:DUF3859 domain-containing protein [Argonema galeatum]|uniref:DUF3859 domain-containing protein n=1 Tax=Argonema galeatum TaxID=2942762 RepID=UPI002010FC8F|nr:DUF3859 domain-containing protein [Argonema galeatum]MCL1463953.1 DUF3859 domain-containing protein [Argonema galeatum A003/A1]
MEPRLTQTQLAQAIAEIEQLSRQRELELTPEQVREILRELNLPDELLEDAIVQMRRREVLKQRQRRNRWIAIATTAVAIAAIGIGVLFGQNRQQQTAQVVAGQDRIALSKTSGDSLTQVSRQTNPRVYYQVTLKNAPIARQLSLQCDWIDPSGQIVHQGRYQTRTIDTPIWNTNCFYNLGSAAPPGNWEVRMSLDGRVISTQPFTVK